MTVETVETSEKLREQPDELSVLVRRAATHLEIDPAFIEKDFWVTEVLRAVAAGISVPLKDNKGTGHVGVVFKGGTSLSRVFGLIERFSEDVDLLVVFPDNTSVNVRDKALKGLADRACTHLGALVERRSEASTKGVKRNYRYAYPRAYTSEAAEDGVLLEMGSRGGDEPHARHFMRSMVATYAMEVLDEAESTWEEWAPVEVHVLAPERTLLEKLAALHDLASRSETDDDASLKLARAARHYYDVDRLLRDEDVRSALINLGPAGVARLAADVDAHSEAAGWGFTPRPAGGYGASVAFEPDGVHARHVLPGYAQAMGMVHGERPAWQDCLATVRSHAQLL